MLIFIKNIQKVLRISFKNLFVITASFIFGGILIFTTSHSILFSTNQVTGYIDIEKINFTHNAYNQKAKFNIKDLRPYEPQERCITITSTATKSGDKIIFIARGISDKEISSKIQREVDLYRYKGDLKKDPNVSIDCKNFTPLPQWKYIKKMTGQLDKDSSIDPRLYDKYPSLGIKILNHDKEILLYKFTYILESGPISRNNTYSNDTLEPKVDFFLVNTKNKNM